MRKTVLFATNFSEIFAIELSVIKLLLKSSLQKESNSLRMKFTLPSPKFKPCRLSIPLAN